MHLSKKNKIRYYVTIIIGLIAIAAFAAMASVNNSYISELEKRERTLRLTLADLEKTKQELSDKVVQLDNLNAEHENTILILEEREKELQKSLEENKAVKEKNSDYIPELEKREKELKLALADLETTKQELANKTVQLDHLNTEHQNTTLILGEREKELQKSLEENEALKEKNSDYIPELEKREKELKLALADLETTKQELANKTVQIDNLNTEHENTIDTLEEREKELQTSLKMNEALEEKDSALIHEIENRGEALKLALANLKTTKKELANKTVQLDNLNTEHEDTIVILEEREKELQKSLVKNAELENMKQKNDKIAKEYQLLGFAAREYLEYIFDENQEKNFLSWSEKGSRYLNLRSHLSFLIENMELPEQQKAEWLKRLPVIQEQGLGNLLALIKADLAQKRISDQEKAENEYNMGTKCAEVKNYQEAIWHLDKAAAMLPNVLEYQRALGRVHQAAFPEDRQSCLPYFDAMVRLSERQASENPSERNYGILYSSYLELGHARYNAGLLELALASYQAAFDLVENHFSPDTTRWGKTQKGYVCYFLGRTLKDLGRLTESDDALRMRYNIKWEQSRPETPTNLNYLAWSMITEEYFRRFHSYREALDIAMKAEKIRKNDPSILDTIATIYCFMGDHERAGKTIDRILAVPNLNERYVAKIRLINDCLSGLRDPLKVDWNSDYQDYMDKTVDLVG